MLSSVCCNKTRFGFKILLELPRALFEAKDKDDNIVVTKNDILSGNKKARNNDQNPGNVQFFSENHKAFTDAANKREFATGIVESSKCRSSYSLLDHDERCRKIPVC